MDQIQRIQHMEELLDRLTDQVKTLTEALDEFDKARGELRELTAYYESDTWQQDLDDDNEGKLPKTLKRGVLSEDAVYDLLVERDEALRHMLLLGGEL